MTDECENGCDLTEYGTHQDDCPHEPHDSPEVVKVRLLAGDEATKVVKGLQADLADRDAKIAAAQKFRDGVQALFDGEVAARTECAGRAARGEDCGCSTKDCYEHGNWHNCTCSPLGAMVPLTMEYDAALSLSVPTSPQTEPGPLQQVSQRRWPTSPEQDERIPECVEQWPDCESGEYNPACCRFPKSCSCRSYPRSPVSLEQQEQR